MERYNCKLCSKIFVNGKALGGHMRSHLVILPIPAKTQQPKQGELTESSSSLSCSELVEEEDSEAEEKTPVSELRENSRRSFRLVDHEILERKTEQQENPTRGRAKRARKMDFANEPKQRKQSSIELEPASSVSDEEEDLALCLMMLSRDTWSSGDSAPAKYRCETSKKIFRSFRALGGDKTCHANVSKTRNTDQSNQKVHKCPVCLKVFSSGQALGGHKRSHFTNLTSPKFAEKSPAKSGLGLIDLNLPAPMEDEKEDYGPAVSAVSDLSKTHKSSCPTKTDTNS
ncbi:hypothetical protein NMG60_11030294 [Bertholletia excelsa]